MDDKLKGAVDTLLKSYSHLENHISQDIQHQKNRFYEIDISHRYVINKLEVASKESKILSSSDEQHIKAMLMESMDLADKKYDISNYLLEMVSDDVYQIEKSTKTLGVIRKNIENNDPKKRKKLLKWPYGSDYDSASTENISISDESCDDEHSDKKKPKLTGLVLSHADEDITEHENSKSPPPERKTPTNLSSSSSSNEDSVEPTYCICEEVSYGNMVCCDNDLCPIEWFHFGCVKLTRNPKGKWFCPKCRGTNSRRMKARKIFLKELEEYNKQKEKNFK